MQKESVGESKGEERKEWERERKRAADTGILTAGAGRWLAERRPAVGVVRGRYGDKK